MAVSRRRKITGPPSRNSRSKHTIVAARLRFELGVKCPFPDLRCVNVKRGYEYRVTVPVPHYGSRKIRIKFSGSSDVPSVIADGPQESRHRFSNGSLCMWYPWDPIDRRWVYEDGLLSLLGLIMAHLFKEAWWQETGEWLGEEVGHGPEAKDGLKV